MTTEGADLEGILALLDEVISSRTGSPSPSTATERRHGPPLS
jgi:hypothetical protein